eukprot:COSAG01_NODE_4971_length_4580_cov_12.996206_4_plen_207_part_00
MAQVVALESSPLGRDQIVNLGRGTSSSLATAELLGCPLFPMFVISVSDLLAVEPPLPPHEQMMQVSDGRGLAPPTQRSATACAAKVLAAHTIATCCAAIRCGTQRSSKKDTAAAAALLQRGLLLEVVELEEQLGNFELHHVDPSGARRPARMRGEGNDEAGGGGAADGSEGVGAGGGAPLGDGGQHARRHRATYSRNRFVAVSHQW